MTVINPAYGGSATDNGFNARTLGYSYSGIYTVVDPKKYNIKSLIDNDDTQGYNNLHYRLPINKYIIYGFSSFQFKDGSGCSSLSL